MLFNSLQFAIFFLVVILVFYLMPPRLRVWLILASSLYFYCFDSSAKVLNNQAVYLLIAIAATYISGILMDRIPSEGRLRHFRRLSLAAGLISDFGMLIYFKYTKFFMGLLNPFLAREGYATFDTDFNLLVPIGISFFVFTSTGYLFDVYRKRIKAEKNPFYLALFVSFFPCIMSGPIEKADHLIPQLRSLHEVRVVDANRISGGISFILWGLFCKMVIADRIAILVDTVIGRYYVYGSVELILAAVCYSIQIYCDFMSYSSIAMGCAKMFGIEVIDNFDVPYAAESIKDFWRRWHISLSTWLKDYVYIPLGGSRCSKIRKYINILITFLVSGFWHGAGLGYIIWGAIHGLLQIIDDVTSPAREKIRSITNAKTDSEGYHIARKLFNFVLVTLAWVYFRIADYRIATDYIRRMFSKPDLWVFFDERLYGLGLARREFNILFLAVLVLIAVDIMRVKSRKSFGDFLTDQPWYFRWIVVFVLFFSVLTFGIYGPGYDAASFIYLQF